MEIWLVVLETNVYNTIMGILCIANEWLFLLYPHSFTKDVIVIGILAWLFGVGNNH